MNNTDIEIYREELEDLTGKIYSGDFTPLVYELLKNTKDKDKLIKALGGEVKPKVKKEEVLIDLPSFDKLFASGTEVR